MPETQILAVATSLCATLFGILILLLGWLGNKIYTKLDEMNKSQIAMASCFHDKLNVLDRRVTVVETKCEAHHNNVTVN